MRKVRSSQEEKEGNENLKRFTFFYQMPKDLWPNVFGHLTRESLARIASTCRLFNDVSKDENVLKRVMPDYSTPLLCTTIRDFSKSEQIHSYVTDPYFFDVLKNNQLVIAGDGKLLIHKNGSKDVLLQFVTAASLKLVSNIFNEAQMIVLALANGHIHFFNQEKEIYSLQTGHLLKWIAFAENGNLMTVNTLGMLRLWNFNQATTDYSLNYECSSKRAVECIAISDHLVALGHHDGISFFDTETREDFQCEENVNSLSVKHIVIEGDKIWIGAERTMENIKSPVLMLLKIDFANKKCKLMKSYDFKGYKFTHITSIKLFQGDCIAVACENKEIHVFNRKDFQLRNDFAVEVFTAKTLGKPYQLAAHADGALFYCGGDERVIFKQTFASKMEVEQRNANQNQMVWHKKK